jgi:nicotinate dehydrogenase subunit B
MTALGDGRASAALPRGLAANPRLSDWVQVGADGRITVCVGKVELGQGILTALAQLAAEELDVDVNQIEMVAASTDAPNEGVTAGSMSVAESGAALGWACANVRAAFVAAACSRHSLDMATMTVRHGMFSDARGAHIGYGEMAGDVDLDRDADGAVAPKSGGARHIVGTSVPRLDLPDKVAGRPRFIHDLELPGQLHARVVRPPSPGARLVDVDSALIPTAGVVTVVRDGSFLGVVAVDEDSARRAATDLRAAARWEERDTLPDENDVRGYLRAGPVESNVILDSDVTTNADKAVGQAVTANYNSSFLAHASIATSCGVAQWTDGRVQVWTHSQGIHPLRNAIAQALQLEPEVIAVQHVEGAGCYGHNGADDAAFDAVLLARSVPERPVHLLWSREDELTWSPFGSAMSIDLQASLDASGRVVRWAHDGWGQGHTSRPGYSGVPGLLASAHVAGGAPLPPPADPSPERGYGIARNAIPLYRFAACRVTSHRALATSMRTSALRSLGAFANVFAIESFMEELALRAGSDPLVYRLDHLDDPRARDVLLAAADLAGWEGRMTRRGDSVGWGIGLARYKGYGAYCAVVAEVEAVAAVRVRRLSIAVDVGLVVNPDGVRNQIEGGAVQSTSWTLKERVRFDRRRITSGDWESYPILRFSEVPPVDIAIMSRPDEPSVGAGEAAQGPTAAAVANAVADALSVRVRDLPITSRAILAAFESSPSPG